MSSPSAVTLPPVVSADVVGLPQADLVAAIPRLRRYARVLTGDPTRADDLVQDTLTRAWEKRRLWRAGSDLRAWMFMIMHNVYVNQLRSPAARRETFHSMPKATMALRGDLGRCQSARARRVAGIDA